MSYRESSTPVRNVPILFPLAVPTLQALAVPTLQALVVPTPQAPGEGVGRLKSSGQQDDWRKSSGGTRPISFSFYYPVGPESPGASTAGGGRSNNIRGYNPNPLFAQTHQDAMKRSVTLCAMSDSDLRHKKPDARILGNDRTSPQFRCRCPVCLLSV